MNGKQYLCYLCLVTVLSLLKGPSCCVNTKKEPKLSSLGLCKHFPQFPLKNPWNSETHFFDIPRARVCWGEACRRVRFLRAFARGLRLRAPLKIAGFAFSKICKKMYSGETREIHETVAKTPSLYSESRSVLQRCFKCPFIPYLSTLHTLAVKIL